MVGAMGRMVGAMGRMVGIADRACCLTGAWDACLQV
jgi:hypothetical protein